jgi:hypothetical protein
LIDRHFTFSIRLIGLNLNEEQAGVPDLRSTQQQVGLLELTRTLSVLFARSDRSLIMTREQDLASSLQVHSKIIFFVLNHDH